MVKHTQTFCWLLLTNCLSVFDHFVGLVPKGLTLISVSSPQNNTTTRKQIMSDTGLFIYTEQFLEKELPEFLHDSYFEKHSSETCLSINGNKSNRV